jgi:sugar phosphate permease
MRFLVPLAIFTLGNASDLFLLLKASGSNRSLVMLPLLWMGLHIVKGVSSVYAGRIADRVGASRTISAGWLFYALIYGSLAFVSDPTAVIALCLVYGVYHGLTEGTEKALVAELAPAHERGAYFGWYHLTVGELTLPASVMIGALRDRYGSASAFGTGAVLALLALVIWLVIGQEPRRRATSAPLSVE